MQSCYCIGSCRENQTGVSYHVKSLNRPYDLLLGFSTTFSTNNSRSGTTPVGDYAGRGNTSVGGNTSHCCLWFFTDKHKNKNVSFSCCVTLGVFSFCWVNIPRLGVTGLRKTHKTKSPGTQTHKTPLVKKKNPGPSWSDRRNHTHTSVVLELASGRRVREGLRRCCRTVVGDWCVILLLRCACHVVVARLRLLQRTLGAPE